jgi:hypothetical protein
MRTRARRPARYRAQSQAIDHRHPLAKGLAGLWVPHKVGGGNYLYDLSGRGNHGTSNGTGAHWGTGESGTVAVFNGTDDYVSVPPSSSIDDLPQLTLVAYLMRPGSAAGEWYTKRGEGGADSGWRVFNGLSNRQVTLKVDFDGGTDLIRRTVTNTYTDGQWFALAITWDGSLTASNVHIYVDGAEASYLTTTNGVGNRVSDAGDNLYIAAQRASSGYTSLEVAYAGLYSRILSRSEISHLYRDPDTMGGLIRARRMRRRVAAAPSGNPWWYYEMMNAGA